MKYLLRSSVLALSLCAASVHAQQNPAAREAMQRAESFYTVMLAEVLLAERQPKDAFALLMDSARKTQDARLYRRAVEAALAGGIEMRDAALEAAKRWADASPDDKSAARATAQLYARLRRPMQAVPFLVKDIEGRPQAERGEALLIGQQLLASADDRRESLAATRLLVDSVKSLLAPNAPEMYLVLSRSALWANDMETALTELRRASDSDPGNGLVAAFALELFRPEGNASLTSASVLGTRAVLDRYLRTMAQVDATAVDYLGRLQRWTEADGKAMAYKRVDELLQRFPMNPQVWLMRGQLSDAKTSPTKTADLNKAIALANDEERVAKDEQALARARTIRDAANFALANAAEERGDLSAAMGFLSQVKQAGVRESAIARMGFKAIDEKRFAAADRLVAELPSLTLEDRRRITTLRTASLRAQNKEREAIAVFDAHLALDTTDELTHYEAALFAEKRKDYAAMERLILRAVEIKPDFAHAYNALGYSFAERNVRLDDAKRLIDRALQATPNDAMIIDSLGWVLFRMGRFPEALRELERAYAANKDAEIAGHLVEVLHKLGRTEDSTRVLREALARDKDNTQLKQLRVRLKIPE
jgi:tetratricopeptide (TPR) repeat protein